MHLGPVNRGAEMSSGVLDGANSVINEQVTNEVAVRMAFWGMLAGKQNNKDFKPYNASLVSLPVQEVCRVKQTIRKYY